MSGNYGKAFSSRVETGMKESESCQSKCWVRCLSASSCCKLAPALHGSLQLFMLSFWTFSSPVFIFIKWCNLPFLLWHNYLIKLSPASCYHRMHCPDIPRTKSLAVFFFSNKHCILTGGKIFLRKTNQLSAPDK